MFKVWQEIQNSGGEVLPRRVQWLDAEAAGHFLTHGAQGASYLIRVSTAEERQYLALMPHPDFHTTWEDDIRRYIMQQLLGYGPLHSSAFRGLHIGTHVPEALARNVLRKLLAEGVAREVKHRGDLRFTWALPPGMGSHE